MCTKLVLVITLSSINIFSTKFSVSIHWVSCHRFPISNFEFELNDVISATFYIQISTQNAEKTKIIRPQILVNWIAFGP